MSWAYFMSTGQPGRRYSVYETASALGVDWRTVKAWIDRGWLTASKTVLGAYKIRHRCVRNCLLEHPEAAETVLRGKVAPRVYRREDDMANRDTPSCRKGT